jgi:hypothetical protein
MLSKEVIEQGKRFEQISREVLPFIKGMENVLLKYGVSKIACLTMDVKDGYFTFYTHESKWEMSKSDSGNPIKLKHNFSEDLLVEDTTEVGGKSTVYVDLQKEV